MHKFDDKHPTRPGFEPSTHGTPESQPDKMSRMNEGNYLVYVLPYTN